MWRRSRYAPCYEALSRGDNRIKPDRFGRYQRSRNVNHTSESFGDALETEMGLDGIKGTVVLRQVITLNLFAIGLLQSSICDIKIHSQKVC